MRILLVHNFYRSGAPGGEDVIVLQEKKLLESRGHDVVLYSRSNDEVQLSRPVQLLEVASQLRGSKKAKCDLNGLLGNFQPDIVHFHNTFPLIGIGAYELFVNARVPIIQTLHNYRLVCAAATHFRDGRVCDACTPSRSWPAITNRCYRKSAVASLLVAQMIHANLQSGLYQRVVDRFLVLTEFAKQRLLATGVASSRITVRPNSLVVDVPTSVSASLPYAVFSGRLSHEKGIPLLLEVWSRFPKLPLKIIGGGPLLDWARAEIEKRGLNAECVGNVSRQESLQLVAGASVMVVPSMWFEGMPLVILEAWALGVPVVGSRIGGIAEMLGANERGVSFTVGDHDSLFDAIAKVISDPPFAAVLSAAGCAEFKRVHEPSVGAKTLEQIYESVLGGRA
jgi:glycosyltransferase involved in cell wall biosynthesis